MTWFNFLLLVATLVPFLCHGLGIQRSYPMPKLVVSSAMDKDANMLYVATSFERPQIVQYDLTSGQMVYSVETPKPAMNLCVGKNYIYYTIPSNNYNINDTFARMDKRTKQNQTTTVIGIVKHVSIVPNTDDVYMSRLFSQHNTLATFDAQFQFKETSLKNVDFIAFEFDSTASYLYGVTDTVDATLTQVKFPELAIVKEFRTSVFRNTRYFLSLAETYAYVVCLAGIVKVDIASMTAFEIIRPSILGWPNIVGDSAGTFFYLSLPGRVEQHRLATMSVVDSVATTGQVYGLWLVNTTLWCLNGVYQMPYELFKIDTLCAEGFANETGKCMRCALGTAYSSKNQSCTPCASNTYRNVTTTQECQPCPMNHYAPRNCSAVCFPCNVPETQNVTACIIVSPLPPNAMNQNLIILAIVGGSIAGGTLVLAFIATCVIAVFKLVTRKVPAANTEPVYSKF